GGALPPGPDPVRNRRRAGRRRPRGPAPGRRQAAGAHQGCHPPRRGPRPDGASGMTKIGDLRAMTTDQLSEELLKLKKEQFNLRFQTATGQMEKTHRVNEV